MLSTVQIKWDMFGKIYPQSAAHITTIHGCFTILQFIDPRSLVLDPRSSIPVSDFRFPIPDSAFPVKQLFIVCSGRTFAWPSLPYLADVQFRPQGPLVFRRTRSPWDEVRYFMYLGKGPKHDRNFWIWSVKGND